MKVSDLRAILRNSSHPKYQLTRPNSTLHLSLQCEIVLAAQNLGYFADVEYKIGNRRADVYISNLAGSCLNLLMSPIVFEIQISSGSPEKAEILRERDTTFKLSGVRSYWLFNCRSLGLDKLYPNMEVFPFCGAQSMKDLLYYPPYHVGSLCSPRSSYIPLKHFLCRILKANTYILRIH